ncbi:hypothetical protein BB560_004617 [Smittium megazygosporum]|uniref:Uncharacterized protein n=1 Tax=Smittium megazygosporum TaxID=133381 RepID=A0A2T9Z8V3_9FUNG|nr:hypothetical protein BB560_004617 [Smittium megazygosporum]
MASLAKQVYLLFLIVLEASTASVKEWELEEVRDKLLIWAQHVDFALLTITKSEYKTVLEQVKKKLLKRMPELFSSIKQSKNNNTSSSLTKNQTENNHVGLNLEKLILQVLVLNPFCPFQIRQFLFSKNNPESTFSGQDCIYPRVSIESIESLSEYAALLVLCNQLV